MTAAFNSLADVIGTAKSHVISVSQKPCSLDGDYKQARANREDTIPQENVGQIKQMLMVATANLFFLPCTILQNICRYARGETSCTIF